MSALKPQPTDAELDRLADAILAALLSVYRRRKAA